MYESNGIIEANRKAVDRAIEAVKEWSVGDEKDRANRADAFVLFWARFLQEEIELLKGQKE